MHSLPMPMTSSPGAVTLGHIPIPHFPHRALYQVDTEKRCAYKSERL